MHFVHILYLGVTCSTGAVDESGAMPYYAEECASMLGVTFSSGTASMRDIVSQMSFNNLFCLMTFMVL